MSCVIIRSSDSGTAGIGDTTGTFIVGGPTASSVVRGSCSCSVAEAGFKAVYRLSRRFIAATPVVLPESLKEVRKRVVPVAAPRRLLAQIRGVHRALKFLMAPNCMGGMK